MSPLSSHFMTRRFNQLPHQPQPSELARAISERLPDISVQSIDEVLKAAKTDENTANPDRLAAIIRVTLDVMRKKSPGPAPRR